MPTIDLTTIKLDDIIAYDDIRLYDLLRNQVFLVDNYEITTKEL